MLARSSALVSLVALAACASAAPEPSPLPPAPSVTASAAPTATPPTIGGHSIDFSAMDTSVKPGNDFFLYANGAWLKKAEIPKDRATTGVWLVVQEEVDKRVRDIIEEAAKAPPGSPLQKVADYYASYLDEAAIEKLGAKPLAPQLARIKKITDKKALAKEIGLELRADVDPMNNSIFHTPHVFGVWIDQDLNNPEKNAAFLLQGGLGMSDRSFYLDASKSELLGKYEKHVAAMLKLAGIKKPEEQAKKIVALEKKIAEVHASRTDAEDASKANNPWPRAEFGKRAPGFAWEAFFNAARLDGEATITAWEPKAMVGIAELVDAEPLEDWKALLTAHLIDENAALLSKAFIDEAFAFYGKTMNGAESLPPRWRSSIDATNDAMGEAVGKAYVAKWFPPSSKTAIQEMVKNLMAAFERRIDGLAWMAPATKEKAKAKLRTLRVGIGYPDEWRDDSKLSIVRGDAYGNAQRAALFDYEQNLAKLGKPVKHGQWVMTPQTVNAVNLPVRNEIQFPAAILSAPFYDPDASPAANYGSTGATIGHEISHSFDNEGSKFDARGQLVDWWTPEDAKHFAESGAALAAQFSAYKPFPDANIDGKLTLSEDIADLAGLAVAYDAWRASLGGALPPTQDKLTGDQQFFLKYAQSWQEKVRPEAERASLATNGHAPPHYRTFTVRNLDAWYGAFDVAPTDALFLAPAARVRVW